MLILVETTKKDVAEPMSMVCSKRATTMEGVLNRLLRASLSPTHVLFMLCTIHTHIDNPELQKQLRIAKVGGRGTNG